MQLVTGGIKHQNTIAPVDVPVLLGPEHLGEHTSPPRVVVVPSEDRYEAPRHGRDAQGYDRNAIRTRLLGWAVHLWGEADDYSDAEELLHGTIQVLEGLARTSCEVAGGGWVDRQAAAWLDLGRLYVLSCTFRVPVLAAPAPVRASLDSISLAT